MRISFVLCCVLLCAVFAAQGADAATRPAPPGTDTYHYARGNYGHQHSGQALGSLSKVGPDSFVLFGGPGTTEGKFQDATAAVPDPQGWIPIDLTDMPTLWQRSQFNMENLNNNGTGNWGMWCGQACDQVDGWTHCPGYGNGWFAILAFERDYLGDTSNGQTVGLDFYFNHDTEPGYDYLQVYYDSAGSWTQVWQQDGSNKLTGGGGVEWPTPGEQYSLQDGTTDIVFVGNDYGGATADKIGLRLVVSSDGGWSDEDGLWPTDAGAAQVDDITVTYDDGAAKAAQSVFEDFEGVAPYAWMPEKAPFVGEFSKFFPQVSDNDPCAENETPVMSFIDDGTPPSNPDNNPPISTGGTTSPTWTYGVPGGWVINYTGGLTFGDLALRNERWTPPIEWDLADTTADDSPFFAGSVLRYTVWRHLPLGNGIFYVWHVRHSTDGGNSWSPMVDRNLVYYASEVIGDWFQAIYDTSDLIGPDPDTGDPVTHVQIALGCWDYADTFNFPGNDASPSPFFDDVAFVKYLVGGPVFSTRNIDTFQDSFPNSGSIDVSTAAARGALDCRIDMAREIGGNTTVDNVKGDSLIVDVLAIVPDTNIQPQNIVLKWRMSVNPLFDLSMRGNMTADGTLVGAGGTDPVHGWDQYEGEVEGQRSTTSVGAVVADRYFWDLPDEDFAYPGDVIYYYVEASDTGANGGNVTTFPANIDGYGTPAYNRIYTIRCLPTIMFDQTPPYVLPEDGGAVTQPSILLVNDFGHRGGENDYLQAFQQNGYVEGVDWDTYTVRGPDSNVSNGIGASGKGGATADQLVDYHSMIYVVGDLNGQLLSDGSNTNLNDKANDLETVSQWHDLPGDRAVAFFGDDLASATSTSSAAGATFVSTLLNVNVNDADVSDEIGNQTASDVIAVHPSFGTTYVAYAGCPLINTFDSITPGAGAVTGHKFVDASGSAYDNVSASVIFDRVDGDGDRIVDMTFPYGFVYVWDDQSKGQASARAGLLQEILDFFSAPGGSGPAVGQDPIARRGVYDLSNYPNPFNPSTKVQFTLGQKSFATVKVFNLRGELVATIARGEMDAGLNQVTWNGQDSNGRSVASGVYVIQVEGDGTSMARKVALVK